MTIDRTRLRDVLGSDELCWLVDRLVKRLEKGSPLTGTVTQRDPTDEERRAVDRLFARRPSTGRSLQVNLAQLEAMLREARICDDLCSAVEAIVGPVADRRAAAAEHDSAVRRVLDDAVDRLADHPHVSPLGEWLRDSTTVAFVKRAAKGDSSRARDLVSRACAMLEMLPARGMSLPELASRITGDSHALDAGRPLGGFLGRAIAAMRECPYPQARLARRDLFASVGLYWDVLSAPVLVLNLTAEDDSFTARQLRLHAETGEPARLSVRQLRRDLGALRFTARDSTVFVCENPAVLATAAEELGSTSRPLVSIEGQPKTAARLLFAGLSETAITLRYHGDFDWPGLHIANLMMREMNAAPWAMSTEDYRRAPARVPLTGDAVEATWEPELTRTMRERGCVVHEESVLSRLLGDLAT